MHRRSAMKNLWFLALVGVLACSCATQKSAPPQDVTIEGVRLVANPAGTARVLLTLENYSSDAIGYNLCSSSLERWVGDDWVPIPTEEVCTMEIRSLDPSRSVAYEKNFPERLPSGEYRYVTSVEVPEGTSPRVVVSPSFRVI